MYALDTISFPGFCGSYEEIHGWSQSHYVDFIVKHHVNHFRFQSLFYSIYGSMQSNLHRIVGNFQGGGQTLRFLCG